MRPSPALLLSLSLTLTLILSLAAADTVTWTGAGRTHAWDFVNNWSPNKIPTASDDVVINLDSSEANVQIGGNPGSCKSLTVGGGSGLTTLTVQGGLNIGAGGAKFGANSRMILQSSDTNPTVAAGPVDFDERSIFVFSAGMVSGSGAFTVNGACNFTEPAAKTIATKVIINSRATITPGNQPGSLNVAGGSLTFSQGADLTGSMNIGADTPTGCTFKGDSTYAGNGESELRLMGGVVFGNLDVNSANVFVDKELSAGAITASSATFTFIGSNDFSKSIASLSGSVEVIAQGGTTSFGSIKAKAVTISGADVSVMNGTMGTLTMKGGSLNGNSPKENSILNVGQGEFSSGTLGNRLVANVGRGNLAGFFTLLSSTLNFDGAVQVTSRSQVTFTDNKKLGVTLSFGSKSSVSQGNALTFVSGGQEGSPHVAIDGEWSSNAIVETYIPTTGKGIFSMGGSASLVIYGTDVQLGGLEMSKNAGLVLKGGSFKAENILGEGHMDIDGSVSASTVEGDVITINNGASTLMNVNCTQFNQNGGEITTAGAEFIDFVFSGGTFEGAEGAVASVTVSNGITLSGNRAKNLNNANVVAAEMLYDCQDECQLFTKNASIHVKSH